MPDRGRDVEIQVDPEDDEPVASMERAETAGSGERNASADQGDGTSGLGDPRESTTAAGRASGSAERSHRDTDDAARLAEELGRTQLRTTDEGYVEARVTALEQVDAETVRLVVELPDGDAVAFRLRKPVPWSREFLLVRLVEHAGYGAATVDHLVGERVLLERGDPLGGDGGGAWEERATESITGKYRTVFTAVGLEDFVDSRPTWRLVDPADLDPDEADTAWLSTLQKLLLATGLVGGSLLALPVIALLTSLSGAGVAALSALLLVLYVGFVARLIVRRLVS